MKIKKYNIAIVGLGNIGSYFFNFIKKNRKEISIKTGANLNIKYVSAKQRNKKRSIKLKKTKWIKNPLDLPLLDVDIIIELVGGAEGIAKKLVFSALKNKKHVITANKSLIAKYGDQLALLAEKNDVNLEFEASVAGGVPVIRSIREGLIVNKIGKISAILNGTSNFILSQMEANNKEQKDVIQVAKKLGYAESNPSSDINGDDVASKIKILSSLAFSKKISSNKIITEGIQNIELKDINNAKNFNYKIKLLGISEIKSGKLFERVHPCLISTNNYLANINDVLNAIIIRGNPIGTSILQGEGAGKGPTSSALLSDLCSIMKGHKNLPFVMPFLLRKKIKPYNSSYYSYSCYLRIDVKDKYGVLASITKILSRNKISIKRLVQIPYKKTKTASIVIITHTCKEKNLRNCINYLNKNSLLIKKPVFIRIEN